MEALTAEMEKRKICLQAKDLLPKYPTKADINEIVRKLHAKASTRVAVLFTNIEDTKAILRGMENFGDGGGNVTIVSTTTWRSDSGMKKDLARAAKGSLILAYGDMRAPVFEEYFRSLTLRENNYTWFREYWRQTFRCETEARFGNGYRKCTGNESLKEVNTGVEGSSARAVINAVHIFACGLRRILIQFCRRLKGAELRRCAEKNHGNYPYYLLRHDLYRRFTTRATKCDEFEYANDFTENGSVNRSFEILNFDGESYKRVGIWRNRGENATNLVIHDERITWKALHGSAVPISSCTLPCAAGETSSRDVRQPDCCVNCKACPRSDIVRNNTCSPCKWNENPDIGRTKCIKIPMMQFGMASMTKVAIFTLSLLLCASDLIVLGIYLCLSKTGRILNEGRWCKLSNIVPCFLSTLPTFPLQWNATQLTCAQQHIFFSVSMATCYAAMAAESYKLYRFASARKQADSHSTIKGNTSKKFRYFMPAGVQILLSIVWVIARPPLIRHDFAASRKRIDVLCTTDSVMLLIATLPCILANILAGYFATTAREHDSLRKRSTIVAIIAGLSLCLWAVFMPIIFWSRAENIIAEEALKALFADVIGAAMLAWFCSILFIDFCDMRQVGPCSSGENAF